MSESDARQLLVKFGRLLYENGFVPGTDGNLSIRVSENSIVVTPSGKAKGFLKEVDLVTVDLDGKIQSGTAKPSSELLMHLAAYKARPDIFACCHAHPPYATAYSVLGRQLPSNILPEVILTIGEIPLTEYAPPGTKAVPKALEKYLGNHQAFLLRNHGVLTVGKSLEEAFCRMETVEHYAKIVYIAESRGKLNILDSGEILRLEEIRRALMREKS